MKDASVARQIAPAAKTYFCVAEQGCVQPRSHGSGLGTWQVVPAANLGEEYQR